VLDFLVKAMDELWKPSAPSSGTGNERPGDRVLLYRTGSIEDVIRGVPPASLRPIALSTFRAGFEAGSPEDVESMGEFISFNGVGYFKSTNRGNGYYQMRCGTKVITNGALFIGTESDPTFCIDVTTPVTFEEFYRIVYELAGAPFCFTGAAVLRRYHATAVARAPIYGQNIFDHEDIYYSEPAVDDQEVPAAVMGCVARLDLIQDPMFSVGLRTVLYSNPMERDAGLDSHTHVLRLSEPVRHTEEIVPANATDVHHLFRDSMISTGHFGVFTIGGFKEAQANATV
jgi:hypothetical protein